VTRFVAQAEEPGCEGNEQSLPYQVKRAGAQAFSFASDFPHEIGPDDCEKEVREIMEQDYLAGTGKEAILTENAPDVSTGCSKTVRSMRETDLSFLSCLSS
jgi:hypothetical protein